MTIVTIEPAQVESYWIDFFFCFWNSEAFLESCGFLLCPGVDSDFLKIRTRTHTCTNEHTHIPFWPLKSPHWKTACLRKYESGFSGCAAFPRSARVMYILLETIHPLLAHRVLAELNTWPYTMQVDSRDCLAKKGILNRFSASAYNMIAAPKHVLFERTVTGACKWTMSHLPTLTLPPRVGDHVVDREPPQEMNVATSLTYCDCRNCDCLTSTSSVKWVITLALVTWLELPEAHWQSVWASAFDPVKSSVNTVARTRMARTRWLHTSRSNGNLSSNSQKSGLLLKIPQFSWSYRFHTLIIQTPNVLGVKTAWQWDTDWIPERVKEMKQPNMEAEGIIQWNNQLGLGIG